MCIGVRATIISINGKEAEADFGGIRRKIRIDVVPDAKVGDVVMVHAGFAISKVR